MAKRKAETTKTKCIEMINVQCAGHKSTHPSGKFLKHRDEANVICNEKGYYNNGSGFRNNNNGGMTAGGKLSAHLHIDEWDVINSPVDQSIWLQLHCHHRTSAEWLSSCEYYVSVLTIQRYWFHFPHYLLLISFFFLFTFIAPIFLSIRLRQFDFTNRYTESLSIKN